MTGPRVAISLAVQVATDFVQILILRAHAVLAVLQHTLLVGIEALTGQNSFRRVVQVAAEVAAVEQTSRLQRLQERVEVLLAACRPGDFAAAERRRHDERAGIAAVLQRVVPHAEIVADLMGDDEDALEMFSLVDRAR